MEPPKGRKKRGMNSLAFFDANLCAWSLIDKPLLIHVLTPSQKVN